MRFLVYVCSWQMASTTPTGQKRPPDKCIEKGCVGEFSNRIPSKFKECIMLDRVECRVKEKGDDSK